MKKILIAILLSITSVTIFAQEYPLTSSYLLNPLMINPSYAGSGSGLRASIHHYNKWVGVKGSPRTNTLSVDMPIGREKVGLGLIMYNDKIGVTKENNVALNYAYRIDVGKGFLAFGLGTAINFSRTNWSELVTVDQGDEMYMVDSRLFVSPNVSFGIYYSYDKFYVGFSIPEFLTTEYDYNEEKQVLRNRGVSDYTYMLNSGYTIDLSKKFSLTPSTLLRYSSTPGFEAYFNAAFEYNNVASLTFSYCTYNVLGFTAQVQISEKFKLGYTYELDVNKMGRYNNGSHSVMLRFALRKQVNAFNPLDF